MGMNIADARRIGECSKLKEWYEHMRKSTAKFGRKKMPPSVWFGFVFVFNEQRWTSVLEIITDLIKNNNKMPAMIKDDQEIVRAVEVSYVSRLSFFHMRIFSTVISLIVLSMLSSPSSANVFKVPSISPPNLTMNDITSTLLPLFLNPRHHGSWKRYMYSPCH